MRRAVALLAAAVLVPAFAAGAATADVHGVSQAGCAADHAPSGATASASRDAPGRPDAPIPVSASPFELATFPGKGGAADAPGTNC
jgi:hypothetical protein